MSSLPRRLLLVVVATCALVLILSPIYWHDDTRDRVATYAGIAAEHLATHRQLSSHRQTAVHHARPSTDSVCDPYAEPGAMYWTKRQPWIGRWVPFSRGPNACPGSPDWQDLVRDANEKLPDDASADRVRRQAEALSQVTWLHNKTVLLIGDSVDRNSLGHIGDLTRSSYQASSYLDPTFEGLEPGWDIRGQPWHVRVEALDFEIHNAFFYGLDDQDEFEGQLDWHPPGKAEDRIDQLFLPYTKKLGRKIDFIQLHSGMWDLALLGRQDSESGKTTEGPLSTERLEWYRSRLLSLVAHVRQAWPDTPIWLRMLHRVGEASSHSTVDYTFGLDADARQRVQNFFTDWRVHNLRQMQAAVATEACLPVFDFNRIWESNQDKVHPHMHAGGIAYSAADSTTISLTRADNPTLHHLHMELQGRQHWRKQPCDSFVPGQSPF